MVDHILLVTHAAVVRIGHWAPIPRSIDLGKSRSDFIVARAIVDGLVNLFAISCH